MAWIALLFAGLSEVFSVYMIKMSEGFKNLKYSLLCCFGFAMSLTLLTIALKDIPASIGYGIWTGIGASGSVLIGMFIFHEPKDKLKLLLVFGIILSIIGLRYG